MTVSTEGDTSLIEVGKCPIDEVLSCWKMDRAKSKLIPDY